MRTYTKEFSSGLAAVRSAQKSNVRGFVSGLSMAICCLHVCAAVGLACCKQTCVDRCNFFSPLMRTSLCFVAVAFGHEDPLFENVHSLGCPPFDSNF